MDTHFFKTIPRKHKIAWRDYYTGQNLSSVRVASIVFLLLNVIIRVFYQVFPLRLTHAENFPEFNIANWLFIAAGAVCCLISYLLIEIYQKIKQATATMSVFIFLFSLCIIICGMYSSFIAAPNVRNALTLYLSALSVISVLCVFEFYETIALIIATELIFTWLLIYNRTEPTEMVYSQLASVVLLSGFYLISRHVFSSKVSYFLQFIEIREKNLEIERGSEFKSQLLGTVAHDLRNPIAAIESLAMLMDLNDIDADSRENLELIKISCLKARTIIEDLLETARNENTIEFITQKTELNRFLMDIVDVWKIQKDAKNIELISSVSPAYAQINHEKFQRVLDNLIGNALKFSKERSRVEVFLTRKGANIVIEVKDCGIGIPKDTLAIIFDPFTKAGRTGLKGEQSTGLGLSIVKQIIEKHNGKIEVESEEGKGSVFRIILPEGS